MSLRRALIFLILAVLATGLIPAGLLVERRLGDALIQRAREDLGRAHMVLDDRMASVRDVRMMHAKEMAHMPELASALARGDGADAERVLVDAARAVGEDPVLVGPEGSALMTPVEIPEPMLAATRRGEMPVEVVAGGGQLHLLALAPIADGDTWLGAAGGSTAWGADEATALAGLTRSDIVLRDDAGAVAATTLPPATAEVLARELAVPEHPEDVQSVQAAGHTYLAAVSAVDAGTVAFLRDQDTELAVLPVLRRTAVVSTALAALVALAVGILFAMGLSRPVASLAAAADRFAAGDEDAPLVRSRVKEVRRVADAFMAMRQTLASRLAELERANRELADRQERLSLLQAELVQRERASATGRVLQQLAHEIRNPVASVRNCLEVVRRSGDLRDEARVFADMAVDELLRMHELAERMLDLHRPRGSDEDSCDVGAVARETASLARAGAENGHASVSVIGGEGLGAAMPPDALKQVLLNLILNAQEVTNDGGPVEVVIGDADGPRIEVLDRGPGIPQEALSRVFDPFFSTKGDMHGVGLGLFTAEGLVRTHGGRIEASNRQDGPGARFVIHLPAAPCPDESSS